MPMLARDLMQSNVLTIPAEMRLREIQHLFVVARVYGAPVVDDRGAIIGVISAADLLQATDQAWDEDVEDEEPGDLSTRLDARTAADIATPDVVWVRSETPAEQVADLLQREGIHRVMVGAEGRLEGILTSFDLLRAVRR